MLRSMTGFGLSQDDNDDMAVEVEIKTVNNRYNDIQIRMPSYLNFSENHIKKWISKRIKRGRVDVFIRIYPKDEFKSEIIVDLDLAQKMYNALYSIADQVGIKEDVKISDILGNEEVLTYKRKELDEEKTLIFLEAVIDDALDKVVLMRETEGKYLKEDFEENLKDLQVLLKNIEEKVPMEIESNHNRMVNNINKLLDANIPLDEDRLANELAIFADKHDINEEIVRLKSHINQFEETIKLDIPIGKKLDFIIQEMNREVNTIQSKSSDIDISNYTINCKALIEKLREQVQNVE